MWIRAKTEPRDQAEGNAARSGHANSARPTMAHPMTHLALPMKGAQKTCASRLEQHLKQGNVARSCKGTCV